MQYTRAGRGGCPWLSSFWKSNRVEWLWVGGRGVGVAHVKLVMPAVTTNFFFPAVVRRCMGLGAGGVRVGVGRWAWGGAGWGGGGWGG